jgi:hypothetical protein
MLHASIFSSVDNGNAPIRVTNNVYLENRMNGTHVHHSQPTTRLIVLAASLGTVFEWYDFTGD